MPEVIFQKKLSFYHLNDLIDLNNLIIKHLIVLDEK